MNKDMMKVRQVIVDVPVYDKNGGLIAEERLSSGGAREPGGALIAQYRNPRPMTSVGKPDMNRELDGGLNREYDEDRRRREEARAKAEHDRRVESTSRLVASLLEDFVFPIARAWWVTRGPDDLKALGRWVTSPFQRHQKDGSGGSGNVRPYENSPADGVTAQAEDDLPEAAEANARLSGVTEDEIAPVVALDDYRARRSA